MAVAMAVAVAVGATHVEVVAGGAAVASVSAAVAVAAGVRAPRGYTGPQLWMVPIRPPRPSWRRAMELVTAP